MKTAVMRPIRSALSANDVTWRYVLNRRAALKYRRDGPLLSERAAPVAQSLKRDGIAILRASELLGRASIQAELVRAADRVQAEWAGRLARLREEYQTGSTGKQKPYSIALLTPEQELSQQSVFTEFALAEPVLEVVNAYFGMYVVLTHCDVWHNFVAAGAPSQSQLWHRDPEDRHILKVFYYLSDVDAGAGPFTYARGSHLRPSEVAPHQRLDGETPRSEDAELAALYPPQSWVTAYGPKGTLVFADTRGYHKGGWSRRSERIVYLCEFVSTAAGRGISTAPRRQPAAAPPAAAPGAAA